MPTSVELRLDVASENIIRTLWAAAATHYGTGYMLRNGVVPHVALVVSEADLSDVFHRAPLPEIEIELDGIGFFSEGEVVYLGVVESPGLRRYQQTIFNLASDAGVAIDEHYRPDRWVPHCTIAQECTRNRGVSLEPPTTRGRVRSLICVAFPPTRVLGERASVQQAYRADG